jgi:hypothetical protein
MSKRAEATERANRFGERVTSIVGVEFQKYLAEDVTAAQALFRAERQIDELYE